MELFKEEELIEKFQIILKKMEKGYPNNSYNIAFDELDKLTTTLFHQNRLMLSKIFLDLLNSENLFQKNFILYKSIFYELNVEIAIPIAKDFLNQNENAYKNIFPLPILKTCLENYLKNKTDSSYPRMIQAKVDGQKIADKGEYNLANIVNFMDEELEKGRDIWTLSGRFRWRYTLKKFFDELMSGKALEYFQNPKNTFALLYDATEFFWFEPLRPIILELEQFLRSVDMTDVKDEELKVFNNLFKNLQELIVEKKYYDKLNFFIPDGPVTKDKPKTMDEIESFIDKELKEGKTLESLDKKMAYKYIIKMFLDSTMGDGMSSFYSNEIQYKDFLLEATLNLRGFKRLYDKLIKVDAILKQADLTELNEEQQKLFDKLCDQVEDLIEDGFYEKLDR